MENENASDDLGPEDDAATGGQDQSDDQHEAGTENEDADEGEGEGGEPADDDHEEVEIDGAKARIPKALKGAFLRQEDYSRKTQELATQRTAFDGQRQAALAADEAVREHHGKVHALKAQIAEYDALNWDELNQADPRMAQSLFFDAQKARQALTAAETALQSKVGEQTKASEAAHTAAMRETGRILSERIPGFNAQKAQEIVEFGKRFGFSSQEITSTADPRAWLLLHAAMAPKASGGKVIPKPGQKPGGAPAFQPAAKAGGGGKPVASPLSDKASIDAFMKARNARRK